MNQKQKRSRSLNWDEEEKLLFRAVLKKYAPIIENKSLDTNTNKKKTEAWEEIHKKFNELNSRHRQLSQLKIQWKSMKINVRKSRSTFRNELNKTGGGASPATPDDSIVEIKDLLNSAELLRDHNNYDSDEIIPSTSDDKVILTTSKTSITNQQGNSREMITLQKSKPIAYVVKALDTCTKVDNINHENQQTADICKETIEDVDAQAEYTPLEVQDHDYVSSLLCHGKVLKEEEHRRRMEMAEKEHTIKMAIHKEKLRSAILEREILEQKKTALVGIQSDMADCGFS